LVEGRAQAVTNLKWDGSPAIVFGRGDNGKFVLTDKSGWQAKGYDGKATSAEELGQMFANRKPAMDQERQQFINNMMDIFDEYEKATPPDFRGFLSGDLMYFNRPEAIDNIITLIPNTVKYEVQANTELGQRILQSKTGVVVHNYIGNRYSSVDEAKKQIQGKEVLIIPSVQAPKTNISVGPIKQIEEYAAKHGAELGALFNAHKLKAANASNIHTLFYRYINSKVGGDMSTLGEDFTDWLNSANLTDKKRISITKFVDTNKTGTKALWTIIKMIMKIKDYLVKEFDSHPKDVKQSINGAPGGEGYVVNHPDGAVKLVSRGLFTAANKTKNR
jgi:hypothetical protein